MANIALIFNLSGGLRMTDYLIQSLVISYKCVLLHHLGGAQQFSFTDFATTF